MSDKEPLTVGKIIGLVIAGLTLVGLVLWGVPSYIDHRVNNGVQTEIARINELSGKPPEVVTLMVQMETVDAFMLRSDASDMRIEGKIDHLTDLFIADLNRRAAQ